MVKKKGQKSAQSKKKLDLAAAVEAAEQGEEESDLSKLNLDDSLAASAAKKENGNMNDDETGTGNDEEEEEAVVMNYNPPEEGPVTEEAGTIVTTVSTLKFVRSYGRTRDYKKLPAFLFYGAIRHLTPQFTSRVRRIVVYDSAISSPNLIYNLNINLQVKVKNSSPQKIVGRLLVDCQPSVG